MPERVFRMKEKDAGDRRVKSLWLWGLTIVANIAVIGPSESTTDPSTSTIQSTPAAPKCLDGWIEENERCYRFSVDETLSWPEARLACQQTPGGDLLVYNSTEEKSYITGLVGCRGDSNIGINVPTNLWIGLHRGCADDPKVFQWIGGENLSDELKNWEQGQPDNFFSDCIIFNRTRSSSNISDETPDNECCVDLLACGEKTSGIYRDEQCLKSQSYICEAPVEAPPEPSPTPSLSSTMDLIALTTTMQLLSTMVTVVESTSSPQPTPTPTFTTTPGLSVQDSPRSGVTLKPSSTTPPTGVSSSPHHSDSLTHSSDIYFDTILLFSTQLSPSPSPSSFSTDDVVITSSFSTDDVVMTSSFTQAKANSYYSSSTSLTKESQESSSSSSSSPQLTLPSSSFSLQPSSSHVPSYTCFSTSSATNTLLTSHNTQSRPTTSSSDILPSQYHSLSHTTTQVPQTTSADDVTSDDPRTTNRDGGSVATDTTSLAPPITSDQSVLSNTSPALTTTTPIMCRAEILDALEWAETIEGVQAVQACPENPFAVVTRTCVLISTTSATWRQPDFRDCQVPTTGDLLDRLTYMYNSPTVEPSDVIKASYQLSQMLAPPTSDDGSAQTNTADEYSLLVESLEMLVALPSRLTDCRPSDLNNFANSILQAVDNMLHPDNLAIWIGNPQVSADTVRVMDAVESFAAQTATANCNLILTPDDVTVPSFEGKYDNVVFRKSVETRASFKGLTYTASSPRVSLMLPPELFNDVTDEQVTLLVVFYPSIGRLLDDVTPPAAASLGSNQKVMSSIVTSTAIHQSSDAFQKLTIPLCINFTKTVATFENEENCVYLGRSESGKSEWLTDGCWVNERKNGSLHCCCNHMTTFGIVGATEVIQQYQLLLLTYVLCSASCFIILLSTLILFSIRHLNSASLTIHTSLAFSIILSFVVVMAGLERTANQTLCRILAIATHYLLTTQFLWSLEGAIHIFFMSNTDREEQRAFSLWIYHVIGWCGPVLPVGVCMALWLEEYGGTDRCWISNNILTGLVVSIGLPAMTNIFLLVYISGKSVTTGTEIHTDTTEGNHNKQRALDGVRSNAVTLTLLSLCWAFGIAAFQLQDDILQQVFAVSALVLGVCFFVMYLMFSHDVRSTIIHARKNQRKKKMRKKLQQRRSDDSLVTTSTSPTTRALDDTGHALVHVQPLNSNDRNLGSTSNTQSDATNCTDLGCDPMHESYGHYQRGETGFNDPAMDARSLGLDQRMLQWRNLGMIGPGPGSLVGETQSPQRRRRGRSESPSALRRSGNVILQHKIVRDSNFVRSMTDKTKETRRHKSRLSSISGSSLHSANMACVPFQTDWRDYRGSRVHPMQPEDVPYSRDYPQHHPYPHQYIPPQMNDFLAQPSRSLVPTHTPSATHGHMHETPNRRDTGALRRSIGGYYGNERQSLRDGFHHMRGHSLDDGYHRDRLTFANEDRPGTSGTNRGRMSDRDAYAEVETPQRQSKERKSERRKKSRGHGGKKHKQKSKSTMEEV